MGIDNAQYSDSMQLDRIIANLHAYTGDAVVICAGERINGAWPPIVFVNEAFERQTGYTRDEAIGATPSLLLGTGTDPNAVSAILAKLTQEKSVEETLLGYRKDSTPFWVNLSISPVADISDDERYWVATLRDVSESMRTNALLRDKTKELAFAARHDHLTKLLNRRGFEAAINDEVFADAPSHGLAYVDLDSFKNINDTLGHETGDFVLKVVANRLREVARPEDITARIGGDEFVIVRRGAQEPELEELGRQVVERLGQPVRYRNHVCRFGVCVGVAAGTRESLASKKLLRNADLALYRSKEAGRNNITVFDAKMASEAATRRELSEDMEEALLDRQFVPYLMPQVDAETRRTTGFEALARWDHPTKGILLPWQFLDVAEDLKLTHQIDRQILEKAIDARKDIVGKFGDDIKISVNVSASRLADSGLLNEIRALEIEPGTISFELLESIYLDDISGQIEQTIDAIKSLGISIEIDDFGTGHASILSLMKVGPDQLKLERAVVSDVAVSENSRKIVEAMVSIAKALGIPVAAEGVETEDQVTVLKEIGCTTLQGYLFGKPAPLSETLAGERSGKAGS